MTPDSLYLYLANAESLGETAVFVYLLSSFFLILACNTVYGQMQLDNFRNRTKPLVFTVAGVLAAQIILMICAFLFFNEGLISEDTKNIGLMHWIFTFTALISVITFWQFRHSDVQFLERNKKENPLLPLFMGIFAGAGLLVVAIFMEMIWPIAVTSSAEYPDDLSNGYFRIILFTTALMAPFLEEFIFRLGIQNIFEHICRTLGFNPINAIGITSILFTAIHMGAVEPFGFKETQIFIFSMVVGYLKFRYGIWSAVAAHLTMNSMILGATFLEAP